MATKKTAKKATPKATSRKLHYDKEALLEEYKHTYKVALIGVSIVIGFALLYFFGVATYLGGWSHNKHAPFVEQFGDEIQIEYEGLKLPIYGDE
jgi:hypothetical protein